MEHFDKTLQKLAHTIYRVFQLKKMKILLEKKLILLIFFPHNIDRRGGPNEHPQSMFGSKNKKNMSTPPPPRKPQFYDMKVVYKGVFITRTCYPDVFPT